MHLGALSTVLALCLLAPQAVALPTASNETLSDVVYDNGLFPAYHPRTHARPRFRGRNKLHVRDDKPFYLRIMPLGASITYGVGSTDKNGYRKHLRDKLRSEGWPVNMVGSQPGGTMRDRDTEGYPGWRIAEIHGAAKNAVRFQPNLVLINAGTNDCIQGFDTGNAGQRMDDMLSTLFDNIEGVTVIVSTLVPNGNAGVYACVKNVNAQYKSVVSARQGRGFKAALADMDDGFITIGDINSDGIHPGDYGHTKMAAVWWDAFQKIEAGITAPADTGMADDAPPSSCDKVYGVADGPHQTQSGSGWDDGTYQHSAQFMGTFKLPQTGGLVQNPTGYDRENGYYDNIFFAQLVNRGNVGRGGELDDIVIANRDVYTDKLKLKGFNNLQGDGSFGEGYDLDVHQECTIDGIRFGDMNNDGLDDFICVNSRGNLYLSLNRGGNPPTFDYLGLIFSAPSGYSPIQTWIADMDGDGRADVCLMASNGDLRCHRNGWVDDTPKYWQEFTGKDEPTFIHQDKGYGPGVRLADLNGDFRADWMWIADDGRIDTFINNRRQSNDLGIKPQWINAGTTHIGMKEANARPRVRLARMYGTNHHDYVYLNKGDGPTAPLAPARLQLEFDVWKDVGSGGTKLKGDGVMYCDIRGTGSDDYLWVFSTGKIEFYGNTHTYDPPRWDVGSRDLLNGALEGVNRRDIHCADWDGDGLADILVTDDATGAIRLWKNEYNRDTGEFRFTDRKQVGGRAACREGRGVGLTDQAIRFADIDGDGRADVLCLQKNGRVYGWLNTASDMVDVGQIKFSEEKDRANLRFADVNGDGRADLLWIEKFNGKTSVWYNMGPIPAGGSSFTWSPQGPLYAPIGYAGSCLHFPNLGGLDRADLHAVYPRTSEAETWFNTCGGSGGSADDDNMDPTLPNYSTNPQNGYTCNNETIYTPEPSSQKWNVWGCPNAWDQSVARWRGESRHIYTFSEAMMYYLGGTQANFECGVDTSQNGCNPVGCQNDMTAASWLILNSMSALNSIMLQFTDAITKSANAVDIEIVTTMVDTFAPKRKVEDLELVSTILGYISLGLTVVSGPFFSRIFSEAIRNGAEYAEGAISTGAEIMDQITDEEKERREQEEEDMDKAGTLHTKIRALYGAWRDAFHQMRHDVFDAANDDAAIGRLYEAIRYGTLGAAEYTAVDDSVLHMHVDQAVYAYLIPEAWKLSGQGNHAFILDAEAGCDEPHTPEFLSRETADANYVCHNGRQYYLVGLGVYGPDDCDAFTCQPRDFEGLPGVDDFTGPPSDPVNHPSDYSWGGVTKETFVRGAVNSFNANGRRNGWGYNTFGRTGRDLFSISAESPGMVQIPVCTGTVAREGWDNGDSSSATYPC